MDKSARDLIRQFIHGRLPTGTFEDWLYASSEAESGFGPELYLKLISADYRSHEEVLETRRLLRAFATETFRPDCACQLSDDRIAVDMRSADDTARLPTLERVRTFGSERPWLELHRCRVCGQFWLLAAEYQMNDVNYYQRIADTAAARLVEANEWPPIFQTYADVLACGAPDVDWSHFRT